MNTTLKAALAAALLVILVGCGEPPPPSERVTIETRLGQVVGLRQSGVMRFLGLRYAQAPVAERRFMPPVREAPWTDTFDATEFGAWCPQTGGLSGLIGDDNRVMDEDCLVLNVWTQSTEGDNRPVLFWIHGGSHYEGSGNDYNGARLAAQGDVVVVTLNYRLGLLGYAGISSLGEAYRGTESNGYRDQILALEWVRDNIADYGGDAANVTIFGESAGGASVLALLASPVADALYHKAISHSGVPATGVREDRVPALAKALGVEPDVLGATLRDVAVERLHEIRDVGMTAGVVDGAVVTRSTPDAIADRGASGVPLIAGFNLDEGTLFSSIIPESAYPAVGPMIARAVTGGADTARYLAAIDAEHPEDAVKHFEQIWFDMFLRGAVGTAQRATETGAGGWLYRFDMKATLPFLGSRLGATHGAEIGFTFNTVSEDSVLNLYDGDDPDVVRLAEQWSNTIIAFARTGNPNGAGLPEWPQYRGSNRSTMVLNAESRVETDLSKDRVAKLKSLGVPF